MSKFKGFARNLLRSLMARKSVSATTRMITQAGLLPKSFWQRLPVEQNFNVPLADGNSFVYSAIANDQIGRALFWRGFQGYEPETSLLFYQLAQKSNVVIDIGANTGVFTLLACAANAATRVISFEPVPQVYARLVNNIQLNGWEGRCQARCTAVSNTEGVAKFHIPISQTFSAVPTSASLHVQGFRGYQGCLIDVPVTTLDAPYAGNERIDLVKIDVEGFEDKVLEGMQRILAESVPAIIVECNPDGPFAAVEATLQRFGYHFFHIRHQGPVTVDRIIPDEHERYRNFLCTVQGD